MDILWNPTTIASRGYHAYRSIWNFPPPVPNTTLVKIVKETNRDSLLIDPYCCKVVVNQISSLVPVTVGHLPREISRFAHFFLQRGGIISGKVISLEHKLSPIPSGGREIPIEIEFQHADPEMVNIMRRLISHYSYEEEGEEEELDLVVSLLEIHEIN